MAKRKLGVEKEIICSYYEYNEEIDSSICEICLHAVPKRHKGNLLSHLKCKHQEKIPEVEEKIRVATADLGDTASEERCKRKKITLFLSSEGLVDACVEMVTINGRPLASSNDSGFRKIIEPLLDALNDGTVINSQSIASHIREKANERRATLSEEMQGIIFSCQVDLATRLGRSIMGVMCSTFIRVTPQCVNLQ